MALGILDSHIKKNENRPHFIHYTKINSKWIKDKFKTNKQKKNVNLPEKNLRGNLLELTLAIIF